MRKNQMTFDELMTYIDEAVMAIYQLHLAGDKDPFSTFSRGNAMNPDNRESITSIIKQNFGIDLK